MDCGADGRAAGDKQRGNPLESPKIASDHVGGPLVLYSAQIKTDVRTRHDLAGKSAMGDNMTLRILTTGVVCSVLMAGCQLNPLKGQDLTDGFSERIIEVNAAYRAERNAQILVNILRARDRQDRKYTGLSELKLSPASKESMTASLGEMGLGNHGRDPWVKLGASSTLDNSSGLELTISPYAKDPDGQAIYTSPITPEQFQSLWNSDWQKSIITSLLVRDLTPLFLTGDPTPDVPAAGDMHPMKNADVVKQLLQQRTPYLVFLEPATGALLHCFNPQDCKMKNLPAIKETDATPAKPQRWEHAMKSGLPAAKTWALPRPVMTRKEMEAQLNADGAFLFCREEATTVPVHIDPTTGATASNPSMTYDVYTCARSPQSPIVCAKKDKDGKCEESLNLSIPMFRVTKDGVYSVTLNSIDDAIYSLGASLRRDRNKKRPADAPPCPPHMICSLEGVEFSSRDTTKVPLIAIATSDAATDAATARCLAQYSAAVRYVDGTDYFAGAPQRFDYGQESKDNTCRIDDQTATVLTFLAELIEIRQAPVTLTPTTLLFRN